MNKTGNLIPVARAINNENIMLYHHSKDVKVTDTIFLYDIKEDSVYQGIVTEPMFNQWSDYSFVINGKTCNVLKAENCQTNTIMPYEEVFFVTPDKEEVVHLYFNPDSSAGGQYVENIFDFDLIKEALDSTKGISEFFSYLEEGANQFLIDINTDGFAYIDQRFSGRSATGSPDYYGEDFNTMYNLCFEAYLTSISDKTVENVKKTERFVLLKIASSMLREYNEREFQTEFTVDLSSLPKEELSSIGIAYTTNESSDDYEIQSNINFNKNTIESFINNVKVEIEPYDNLYSLVCSLEYLDFSEVVGELASLSIQDSKALIKTCTDNPIKEDPRFETSN